MTRGELTEALQQDGHHVQPPTINHAVACGHVDRPTKNGAGIYEYTTEHYRQMVAYLSSPRQGRKQQPQQELATV